MYCDGWCLQHPQPYTPNTELLHKHSALYISYMEPDVFGCFSTVLYIMHITYWTNAMQRIMVGNTVCKANAF